MLAIDANVIIRYLTQDHAILSPKADAIIEGVEDGCLCVFCDPIILGEVVWVLSSHYQLDRAEVIDALEPIVNLDGFVIPDKERYVRALGLFASRVPHFGDACACAAALEECKGRLLSFDKSLSRVDGVQRTEELG
jgi:predicted nucleic-acid-binding protein